MKLKNVLSGLLVVGVTLSLTACGSGDKKDGADGKKDRSEMTEKELAKEERVKEATLEIYLPAGKNTDYLEKSAELYNKKYDTDIKLKTVDVAPAIPMVQKVTPKLVANEKMPDMIFLQDSNAGAIFEKFEDLFYSSEEFGFIDQFGTDFYPAKMNMLANIAPSKKSFGFPNDWGNAAMFYNNAAFEEAGVKMADVKTWDQLIEAGKKLKDKTDKKLVFMRDTGELDLVKYMTEQQGVSLFDKNGNLNLLDPAVETSYEIIKKLEDADLVAYGNSKDYTAIGQESGVIFAGGWLASYQAGDYPDDEGKWRIGAMPAVEQGKIVAPMSGGSSYYIPKKSDNALAAFQFITFTLTDPEALDTYMELSGLPANTKAYESDVAQKEFSYYGNQQILQTLNEISQTSIEGYAFPYSADLDNYIEAASYDIKKNKTPVKEALQKQADEFAAKYGVKVTK